MEATVLRRFLKCSTAEESDGSRARRSLREGAFRRPLMPPQIGIGRRRQASERALEAAGSSAQASSERHCAWREITEQLNISPHRRRPGCDFSQRTLKRTVQRTRLRHGAGHVHRTSGQSPCEALSPPTQLASKVLENDGFLAEMRASRFESPGHTARSAPGRGQPQAVSFEEDRPGWTRGPLRQGPVRQVQVTGSPEPGSPARGWCPRWRAP